MVYFLQPKTFLQRKTKSIGQQIRCCWSGLSIFPLILSLPEEKVWVKVFYITVMLRCSFMGHLNFTIPLELQLLWVLPALFWVSYSTCLETKFCTIHFSEIKNFIVKFTVNKSCNWICLFQSMAIPNVIFIHIYS